MLSVPEADFGLPRGALALCAAAVYSQTIALADNPDHGFLGRSCSVFNLD